MIVYVSYDSVFQIFVEIVLDVHHVFWKRGLLYTSGYYIQKMINLAQVSFFPNIEGQGFSHLRGDFFTICDVVCNLYNPNF